MVLLAKGQNNEGEEDDDLIDINENDHRSEESVAGFRRLNFYDGKFVFK